MGEEKYNDKRMKEYYNYDNYNFETEERTTITENDDLSLFQKVGIVLMGVTFGALIISFIVNFPALIANISDFFK